MKCVIFLCLIVFSLQSQHVFAARKFTVSLAGGGKVVDPLSCERLSELWSLKDAVCEGLRSFLLVVSTISKQAGLLPRFRSFPHGLRSRPVARPLIWCWCLVQKSSNNNRYLSR